MSHVEIRQANLGSIRQKTIELTHTIPIFTGDPAQTNPLQGEVTLIPWLNQPQRIFEAASAATQIRIYLSTNPVLLHNTE